jgi:hypothetical protein
MLIKGDLEAIKQRHYPGPPASNAEIGEFEAHWHVQLDPDLATFYRACNGAKLFDSVNAPFEILPLDEVVRARVAIYGRDENEFGPATILAICDVEDGNYVGIDISKSQHGYFTILDLFHETFPKEAEWIADSFGEFLHGALHNDGRHFWIDDGK